MKKFTGFIVAAAAVLSLAACGSGDNNSTDKSSSSDSAAGSSQLDKIKEAGVLKIGTSADFAPFEFRKMVDGKDTIVGADIDMANAIADELGVKAEFVNMDFDAVLASLQQGNVDLAISGISATPEREKTFDFSINYFNPPQVLVVNKKNVDTFTSIDDLSGKKIGAQKGSIQEDIAKDQIPEGELVSLTKVPNLIIELNEGTIDGLVLEKTIAEAYISQNDGLTLSSIELTSSEDEAYAIAMPKDSGELKTTIDDIVQQLIDEGKIDEFVEKNTALMNEDN